MKKLLLLGLVALLALSMVACSNEEEKVDKVEEKDQDKSSKKEDDKKVEKENEKPIKQEEEKPKEEITPPTNTEENKEEVISTGEYNAKMSDLKASMEKESLRLDLTITSDEDGQVYVSDGSYTNIGPIDIEKGTYSVYFLLNVNNKNTYTITLESETKKTTKFEITQDMINQAMVKDTKTTETVAE